MKAASIATMFLITLSTAARGQTEGIAQFTGQTRLGDRTLPSHVRVLVRGGTSRIEVEMNLKGSASRRPGMTRGVFFSSGGQPDWSEKKSCAARRPDRL